MLVNKRFKKKNTYKVATCGNALAALPDRNNNRVVSTSRLRVG